MFVAGGTDLFPKLKRRQFEIEALIASNQRVADWRAFGGIDADSVCHERALYARVRAALPSGSALGPA